MSAPNICNGDITLSQQIVSSSAGAFLTSVMVTPMDVVKIRLQSQVHPIAEGECFLYSNGLMDHLCVNCADPKIKAPCQWYNRPGHFTGTIDAFVKIARNEGVRSLWSGLSPTIVSAIPATVFYFTIYDNLLHTMRNKYGDRAYVPLFVGAIARAIAVTVVSPIEMIRTKMQSEALSYREIGNALVKTIRNDGYIALWRGLGPTILRDIPFSALYWTTFEALKKEFMRYFNRDRTDFAISFTCGAISGTVAAVVTLPFDVIKTHRQITLGEVQTKEASSLRKQFQERATLPLMRELARKQGYRALFAGLTPRVAKIAPACATMIASYDYLKNVFSKRNKETCRLNNLSG
uniref:Solute carrier family 25 member 40 n=1 Tax=Panagrellus redivivus TaxID=6233 RepID=A0A7E4UN84_PANRE